MDKGMSEREKWFKARIGRRVFRTAIPNSSLADEKVYNLGQIIYNREHAEWLFEKESNFRQAGTPVTYFGSMAERDAVELV